MGKIILTQEFDSFEERDEFLTASKAVDMKIAIDEIMEMLRKYDKYGQPYKDIDELLEKIREEAYEILNSRNLLD